MKTRYSFIDSSRGLAASSVVLHHFIYCYTNIPDEKGSHIFSFLYNGSSPVAYFFVLSGFILSIFYLSGEKDINQLDYRKYLVQRIFRIYPLFLACLIISYVCSLFLHSHVLPTALIEAKDYRAHIWASGKSVGQVLKEAILIKRFPPHPVERLVPQDWTLTIELIMSFTIPLLVLCIKRNISWFLIVVGLIFYYDMYITGFALGVLLANFRNDVSARFNKLPAVGKLFLVLSGLLFYSNGFGYLDHYLSSRAGMQLILESVGSVVLLGALVSSCRLQAILSYRSIVFLGKISFAVYLTHFFLLLTCMPYIMHYLAQIGLVNETVTLVTAFIVLMALTCIISAVFHEVVEKPFIRMGAKLIKAKMQPVLDTANTSAGKPVVANEIAGNI